MAERLKAHAWKACVRASVPWVRIPLPPPYSVLNALIWLTNIDGSPFLPPLIPPRCCRLAVDPSYPELSSLRSCAAPSNCWRRRKSRPPAPPSSCESRRQRVLPLSTCASLAEFFQPFVGLMLPFRPVGWPDGGRVWAGRRCGAGSDRQGSPRTRWRVGRRCAPIRGMPRRSRCCGPPLILRLVTWTSRSWSLVRSGRAIVGVNHFIPGA
jgi:hypothetical protein